MNKQLQHLIDMPWHFCIEPSEWEGKKGVWVYVAELPDCSTFAATAKEGLSAVAELLPVYLEAAMKSQARIPTPVAVDDEPVSGQLNLRIPKSLHLGLKRAAARENTSLNQYALFALTRSLYETAKREDAQYMVREATAPRKPSASRKRTGSAKRTKK